MECGEVPQGIKRMLPIKLEDAKMDVDADSSEGLSAIDKEEGAVMDVCGNVVDDVVKTKNNESVNGKDELDTFREKSSRIPTGTEKTSPQVHSAKIKTEVIIDKTNPRLIKEEASKIEDDKDEQELGFSEEFLIPEYISDKEFATSEEMLSCCPWELGQLAWARMSIYPFWPCIVTYEPSPVQTYRKIQSKGRSKTLMIHVHFFNDHGRHSWIPSHHMIPFNGIEDFRKRAKSITDGIRKKEPKFAAALVIKPNIFSTWQKAVAEAMDVLYELDMSTLENFKKRGKKEPSSSPDEPEPKRKRKSKGDDDGKEVKKARRSITQKESNTNDNEIVKNLNLDTPPSSPVNSMEYRKQYKKKQKRIKKMIDKLQPPTFEVFRDREYDKLSEEYPDATDEHKKMYVLEMWNKLMKDVTKLKYRSEYKVPSDADQKDLELDLFKISKKKSKNY